MPVHVVPCGACGRKLERRTYWRQPLCGPQDDAACYAKRDASRRRNEREERKRAREQARRYRVLMQALAWLDFDFDANVQALRRADLSEVRFWLSEIGVRSRARSAA